LKSFHTRTIDLLLAIKDMVMRAPAIGPPPRSDLPPQDSDPLQGQTASWLPIYKRV
jgi:hypothetical protein